MITAAMMAWGLRSLVRAVGRGAVGKGGLVLRRLWCFERVPPPMSLQLLLLL